MVLILSTMKTMFAAQYSNGNIKILWWRAFIGNVSFALRCVI